MKDVELNAREDSKLSINRDKDEATSSLNATYAFTGEDHTLGNLLRNVVMKDLDTQFCGYSIPHPSEEIMNIRLQTHSTHTDKVINKGLLRISKMCDILTEKFQLSLNEYRQKSG